jgi:NADPH:quinone reductase
LQAVQVERFGVENLKVQEVADPVPGPGEALIATEAATINPADLAIVTGTAASRFPPEAVAPLSRAGISWDRSSDPETAWTTP